jgi:hypothetical protein
VAEVLEFPSRESQAYAFLERELTALLLTKGADQPLIEFTTRTLRAVYADLSEASDYRFSVDLPSGISAEEAQRLQQQIAEGVDGLRHQHHDVLVKMAARLVLTEMRLFQQQRSES